MLPNVAVTAAAQKFMRRMVRFGGQCDHAGFRLTVATGGCSGYDASFSVVPAPLPGDETLEINGLALFLPAESRLLLEGVTVDFADTPTSSGLTFFNPSASACACSSSTTGASAQAGVTKISLNALHRR